MPDETPVDELYQNFQELIAGIDPKEVSLRGTVQVNFAKSLLLAAASYFEEQVKSQILDFVRFSSSNNKLVVEFVQNKAIGRQYHSLFDWDAKNANKFFSFFGRDFQQEMHQFVQNDRGYADAIEAFLAIGRERNRLVHQNYAQISLEQTVEEIYYSYKIALQFVDSIDSHLGRISADIASRSFPSSS